MPLILDKRRLNRLTAFLVLAWCSFAAGAGESDADLDELKALGNVEAAPTAREDTAVTSVGRKTQRASESAAAIYVITQEDIRRSGVTSIPEALRMAPGIQVARVNANKWAISARGFNSAFANKLLVLMDGREVYNPTFGGVYWETQDYPLDDIERIEVIRGPGASLWGANAVNGVISIITKHARDSHGGSLTAGVGSFEQGFGSLRYGAEFGENTHGRIYAKGFNRGNFDSRGDDAHDDWSMAQTGFRLDHDDPAGDRITLEGNAYRGSLDQLSTLPVPPPRYSAVLPAPVRTSGFNLLGRWSRALSINSEMSLQAYYDHTYRSETIVGQERDTVDLEFQHRFLWDQRHDITWGLGYRLLMDKLSSSYWIRVTPPETNNQLFSAFFQDDISLIDRELNLILGAKLQHNDYSGFEGQPTIRLLWTPNQNHRFWSAVSRAVRTPTRLECCIDAVNFVLPPSTQGPAASPFPVEVGVRRNPAFRAENVWAYELGYRFQPDSAFSVDLALFYNDYRSLRYWDIGKSDIDFGNGLVQVGLTTQNGLRVQSYGGELAVDWRPLDFWGLQLSYNYLHFVAPTISTVTVSDLTNNPSHQLSLRSSLDLGSDVDLDLWFRYIGSLGLKGTLNPEFAGGLPAYKTLDARLAWRPFQPLELSLVGQNLLDSRHPELLGEFDASPVVEVPRSFYLQFNLKF